MSHSHNPRPTQSLCIDLAMRRVPVPSFRRLLLEPLEDRSLLASIVLSSGGVLQIQGDDNVADVSQVSLISSGASVKAVINSISKVVTRAAVSAITFYGSSGDDTFKNLTSIFASAHGEAGNDKLYGGAGVDWLEGGTGNDYLEGSGGNDRYRFKGSSLGTDTIVDSGGTDSIDLSDRGGSNTLDLSRTGVQTVRSGHLNLNLMSGSSMEKVNGSIYADVIYGNSLANTLTGNGGADRLYGRGGNDRLEGGSGNDSLFGGSGSDTLFGESGDDRFLAQVGDTTSDYNKSNDAKINFTNGGSSWTDAEIEVVDRAFAKLYDRTGNHIVLRDPVFGPALTFQKVNVTEYVGRNSVSGGVRTISIDEWDQTSTVANDSRISTVIHEIGHNFDNEMEELGFPEFRALSGWTQTRPATGSYTLSKDGKWYHRSSAAFARDYGKTNPREDWSTVWQVYFESGYDSSSPIAAKLEHVDGVMDWFADGAPLF